MFHLNKKQFVYTGKPRILNRFRFCLNNFIKTVGNALFRFFSLFSRRYHNIYHAKQMIDRLYEMESEPVRFLTQNKKTRCDQTSEIESLTAKIKRHIQQLNLYEDERTKLCAFQLSRYYLGLLYRLEKQNGGLDHTAFHYSHFKRLVELARVWKAKSILEGESSLTTDDISVLKQSLYYHKMIDILLECSSLREHFFKWSIRDKNKVEVFMQFPGKTDWLIHSEISQRLGRFNGRHLQLKMIPNEDHIIEKHITLSCEGRNESILDQSKIIIFRGNYQLTVEEILQVFSEKFYKVGNLELFANGVENWNTMKLGYWDADIQDYILANLMVDKWWEELPCFESVTKHEIESRYNIKLKDTPWIASVHATRGYLNLSYERTHAFMQIAIPNKSGGYNIYDFGKYGQQFPSSLMEGLKLFTQVMRAGVMYPDENVYYSFRQHGYYPLVLTQEQSGDLMDSIREDIFHGFAGKMVYQIESENCAKWVYETFGKVIGWDNLPNFFKMPLLDTEPGGPMERLFNLIKHLPRNLQSFAITRLHYPIGAWRGIWVNQKGRKLWRSLSNHLFWESGEVYLPALVVKKRVEGLFDYDRVNLNGKTTWDEMKQSLNKTYYNYAHISKIKINSLAKNILVKGIKITTIEFIIADGVHHSYKSSILLTRIPKICLNDLLHLEYIKNE